MSRYLAVQYGEMPVYRLTKEGMDRATKQHQHLSTGAKPMKAKYMVAHDLNGQIRWSESVTDVLPRAYVTVYMPIAGWKSVLFVLDEEYGFHEPWQTGDFGYATKAEAIKDAWSWAQAEELPLIDLSPGEAEDAPDKSVIEQLLEIIPDATVVTLDSKQTCYQCEKEVDWLAPDSRCGDCTGYTPDTV